MKMLKKIVFVGDSMTDAGRTQMNDLLDPLGAGFVRMTAQELGKTQLGQTHSLRWHSPNCYRTPVAC